tara:strand:- start:4624 stop:6099 length:1476 start_codon:yes stop_codon:yes gene_type:complete
LKTKYKIIFTILAILLCVYLVLAAPSVTNNIPANDTYTNDNTPTVNFTVVNGADGDNSNYTAELLFNNTVMRYNITNVTNATSFLLTANTSIADGCYKWFISVNDSGATNGTANTLTIDTTNPQIGVGDGTATNNSFLSNDWIYLNASITETNPANITFMLYNTTAQVNSTIWFMGASNTNNTINWTGLPDGNYTYNATIVDEVNQRNTTVTRSIIVDTTAPNVTIEGPANATADADGVNFTFNVTDAQQVNNCTLYAMYSKAQVDTSIIKNVTQSFVNLSLPISDNMLWYVTCIDNSSNKGNSSVFSIDTNATVASTSSSSSSTTTGVSSNTFSAGEITDSYEKTLDRGEKVSFDIDGEEYKIKFSNVNDDNTVGIYYYGTRETYDLAEGDSIDLDVDEDGEYDITVTCESIIDDNTVKVVIGLYSETSEAETAEDTEEEEEELVEEPAEELGAEEVETEETGSKWWLWVIIAAVVAIIVAGVVFFIRKK